MHPTDPSDVEVNVVKGTLHMAYRPSESGREYEGYEVPIPFIC
jgi:hypothetical protein